MAEDPCRFGPLRSFWSRLGESLSSLDAFGILGGIEMPSASPWREISVEIRDVLHLVVSSRLTKPRDDVVLADRWAAFRRLSLSLLAWPAQRPLWKSFSAGRALAEHHILPWCEAVCGMATCCLLGTRSHSGVAFATGRYSVGPWRCFKGKLNL